jgi:hypothetical protein
LKTTQIQIFNFKADKFVKISEKYFFDEFSF